MQFILENILWVILTLIGAVIGGWLSGRSQKNERAGQPTIQLRAQLEVERHLAYTKLLRLASRSNWNRENGDADKLNLESELEGTLSEIEILASPLTREHALAYGLALVRHLEGRQTEETKDMLDDHRRRFIIAVRKELGFSQGSGVSDRGDETYLTSGVESSSDTLAPEQQSVSNNNLPLPIATGGVGLLIAYTLPNGLLGWQGFLVGVSIGSVILIYASNRAHAVATTRRLHTSEMSMLVHTDRRSRI